MRSFQVLRGVAAGVAFEMRRRRLWMRRALGAAFREVTAFDTVERRDFVVAPVAGPFRRNGRFRGFVCSAGLASTGFLRTAFLCAADEARRRFIVEAPRAAPARSW
jgi:hypothetical protein